MFLCTLPGFKASGKKRLTLAEFDLLLRKFIRETYHERPHGETGVPPSQRWELLNVFSLSPHGVLRLFLSRIRVLLIARFGRRAVSAGHPKPSRGFA